MYASIRKYKTDAPGLVIPLIRNEFLPLIKALPGFVNYFLIESEADSSDMTTVSIFESKEGAIASSKLAAEWIQNKDFVKHLMFAPEITSGEVKATSMTVVPH